MKRTITLFRLHWYHMYMIILGILVPESIWLSLVLWGGAAFGIYLTERMRRDRKKLREQYYKDKANGIDTFAS